MGCRCSGTDWGRYFNILQKKQDNDQLGNNVYGEKGMLLLNLILIDLLMAANELQTCMFKRKQGDISECKHSEMHC